MVTAPLLATISMEKNGVDDTWSDPRFKVLANVHCMIWIAIRLLVKGNSKSEHYTIDLKAKVKKLNALDRKIQVEKFIKQQDIKDKEFLETKFNFNEKTTTRRFSINTFNKQKQEEKGGEVEESTGKVKGIQSKLSSMMSGKSSVPTQQQQQQQLPTVEAKAEVSNDGEEEVKGIDVMIIQMPFPVGASQTLTSIVDENMELLGKITQNDKISDKTAQQYSIIEKFKLLVTDEGPIYEALNFFKAICCCDGKYLRNNQDLIVKELLRDSKSKASYLFEVKMFPIEDVASQIVYLGHKFKEISPKIRHKLETENCLSVVLDNDLSGHDADPIFVKWNGVSDWKPGKENLFFDPRSIGYRYITVNNEQWVLLQDLCEPLSTKFSEKMKGLSEDLKKEIDEELKKKIKFKRLILERQFQIATYFIESINLYAELCGGRAYQAKKELQLEFSYKVLLNILSDNRLPLPAKGSFVKLTSNLWISQYPHSENCGRQCIPKRIWIESTLDKKYMDMFTTSKSSELKSQAENILPHFVEFKNEKKEELDEDIGLISRSEIELDEPMKYKFELLVVFVKDFFKIISNRMNKKNNLRIDDIIGVRQAVEMARLLLSYGFIPDLEAIEELCDYLKKLLNFNNNKTEGKNRYNEKDEMNFSLMQLKTQILKLLIFEEQLQNEIKLASFLSVFKYRQELQGSQRISSIMNISKNEINDQKESDFDKRLLDLSMHGDDELFENSLKLFQVRRLGLRTLLDNASQVKLLKEKEILKQITIKDMDHLCSDWKRLYENVDLWDDLSMHSFKLTLKNCKILLGDNEKRLHQEILTLLDLHNLLLMPLKLDIVSQDVAKAFEEIRSDSMDSLLLLVEGNKAAAEAISKQVALLTENFLDSSSSMKKWNIEDQLKFIEITVAVFRGNKLWIMKTPKAMFRNFVSILIPSEGKICNVKLFSLCLDFYLNQLTDPTVVSILSESSTRNQNLVFDNIDNIISKNNSEFNKATDYDAVLVKVANQGENYRSYLKYINILGLVSLNNPAASNNAMNTIIRWDHLATMIVKFYRSNKTNKMLPHVIRENRKEEDEYEFLYTYINLFHNAYCDYDTYDEDIIFNMTTHLLTEAIVDTFKDQVLKLKDQKLFKLNEKPPLVKAPEDSQQEIELKAIYPSFNDDDDDDIQMTDNRMVIPAEIDNPILENILEEINNFTLTLSRYKLLFSCLNLLESYRKIYFDSFRKENSKLADELKPLCDLLLKVPVYSVTDLFPEEETKPKVNKVSSLLSNLSLFQKKKKQTTFKDLTPEQMILKKKRLEELNSIQKELSTYAIELYKLSQTCGQHFGCKIEQLSENENKISQTKKSAVKTISDEPSNQWTLFKNSAPDSLEEFIQSIQNEFQDSLIRDENSVTEDFVYTTWKKVLDEKDQVIYLNQGYDAWLAEKSVNFLSVNLATYDKVLAYFNITTISAVDHSKIKGATGTTDEDASFQELVERMIKYVSKTVTLGEEHVLTQSILNIFFRFLEIGQENDAKHGTVDGVNQFMIEELTKRQITLNNFNIVKMLHELLSSNCPSDVFLSATKLTSIMLRNGNNEVQRSMLNRMRKKDAEGKFFNKVRDSFMEAIKFVNRTRYTTSSDITEYKGGIDDQVLKKVELISIPPMLTQFCEGHYHDAQSILLSQIDCNNQTFNIIESAFLTLFSLVPSIEVFTRITRVHSEILLILLDFLSEVVQGPNVENQQELNRLNIFATCRIMLISPELQYCYNKQGHRLIADPDCEPKNPTLTLIKAKAMVLLSAINEGQFKKDLIDDLTSKIEPAVFKTAQHEVLKAIVQETKTTSKVRASALTKKSSLFADFITRFSIFARDDSFNNFDNEKNTYIKSLASSSCQLVGLATKLGIFKTEFTKTSEEIKSITTTELESIHQHIVGIEVNWQDSLHEVYFVVPIKCRYLSEMTKLYFLDYEVSVDNNSCDSRKKQLMDKKDVFVDEMDVFYHLGSTIPLFRFMLRHSLHYKMVLFGISVLLNFHIMISSLSEEVLVVSNNTTISGSVSFSVKVILGIIIIIMHIVLFLFYFVAGFDLKRRALNRSYELGKDLIEKNKTRHPVKIVEIDQLILPIFVCLFYLAGCIVHFYNFQDRAAVALLPDSLRRVYVYVGVVIFAPIFIIRLRSVFRYPINLLSFGYCLAVDTITIPSIISSGFFVIVSYCGLCYHYAFFSLLLTDFLSISEDAYTVMRSVTVSTYALSNLVVIFLIVIIIYAIYAYAYFGSLMFLPDSDGNTCESLLSCIGLTLYQGILNGNLLSLLQPPTDSVSVNESYAARFFYDILFAVSVGQLLMNMGMCH